MQLKILSLDEANAFAKECKYFGGVYCIQLLDYDSTPDDFPDILSGLHSLRLRFDDIIESPEHYSVRYNGCDDSDIRSIVRWANVVQKITDTLIVHCVAGISRSPAAALIALLAMGKPLDDAERMVLEAAPYCYPNPRMLALADPLLKQDGKLIALGEKIRRARDDRFAIDLK